MALINVVAEDDGYLRPVRAGGGTLGSGQLRMQGGAEALARLSAHTHRTRGGNRSRWCEPNGTKMIGPPRSQYNGAVGQGWRGIGARGTITNGAGSVFRTHVFGVYCCIALHLNADIGHQTQRSGEFVLNIHLLLASVPRYPGHARPLPRAMHLGLAAASSLAK